MCSFKKNGDHDQPNCISDLLIFFFLEELFIYDIKLLT